MHPQGEHIFFWAKFTGKVVSAPQAQRAPPRQSKSNFLGNWVDVDGGRGYLGIVLACFDGDY